mmetsp:Transcript_122294/g.280161  ORF Transcript_122294/g.280161 Transcript_122294/m.280161 type:complete len:377 (+) Transcript_122294:1707-2837(+)
MPLEPMQEVVVDPKLKPFLIPKRYELVKKLGSGAYGCVASFKDAATGEKVAVKKIQNAYSDVIDGKRILREIRLMRHFQHDNVSRIRDLIPPNKPQHDDIYIVMDLMETDLHRVIHSKQPLTEEHFQYFLYQILRGLLYLHSANVIHRDLKPANLLVNKNCDLQICDFGLARGFGQHEEDQDLTDYVVTRWYRAPEVILTECEYTKSIDIWSVGCILCEMFGRTPFLMGKDYLDQVKKILETLGTPTPADQEWIPKGSPGRKVIERAGVFKQRPLSYYFPKVSPEGLACAESMLAFDPQKRSNVQEVLEHKYLKTLHDPRQEPKANFQVSWEFDNFRPTKAILQERIYAEVARFHPDVLQRDSRDLAGLKWNTTAT